MVSIVVPVYNEKEGILAFYRELCYVVKSLKQYEIILVDDGSTDTSLMALQTLEKKDPHIRVFSFRKHQGKAEALTLGFQKAKGTIIITLDADLEDQPNEIPKLLEKLNEGWDMVSGWRKNRKHPWFMQAPSRLFNFLANTFWGLRLHDYNCGLKAYTNKAAASLRLYGGLYRFIPLLLYQEGYSVTEVPVVHGKRKYGKSKYGFSKVWKDAPDMLTMLFLNKYGSRPLHFFGVVGLFLFVIGIVILSYLTIEKIFFSAGLSNRPILFLGMLLVISGLQTLFTGFLADLFINYSSNMSKQKDAMHFSLKYGTD